MSNIVVNMVGIALMLATVWWFWLAKPKQGQHAEGGKLRIRVSDGTYDPPVIDLRTGESVTLELLRQDPSPCAEFFIVDGLDVSVRLPVNSVKPVKLGNLPAGEYPMHCQMNMYQGTIRVH